MLDWIKTKAVLVALICAFSAASSFGQFYRGSHQVFGKNRIQYESFEWDHYDFPRFNIYFYGTGNNLAAYTAKVANETAKEFQKRLDYRISSKYYIVIFNSQSDWRQSNIGLEDGDDQNIGGVTRIQGNKLFLYFEGDHEKLKHQIRQGLAEIYVRQMMFGENWKEVLKNSALLTLPDWYVNGLVSYLDEPWSPAVDGRMRDGVISERFSKFNRLTGVDARVAGHSLWHFIAEIYGPNVVPNILYMARISRNVESGFLFVLGVSLATLIEDSLSFYRDQYEFEEKQQEAPSETPVVIRTRKSRTYHQLEVGPVKDRFAMMSNELGQYKVWLYETYERRGKLKAKRKRILKGEHKLDRIPDVSYPLLDWHPAGDRLGAVYEKKGELVFAVYDLEAKSWQTENFRTLDKVLDFSFAPDGKTLALIAIKNSQTDLFTYSTLTKSLKQLTFDQYDELDPSWTTSGDGIVFASNRTNDTLKNTRKEIIYDFQKNNDLFIYNTVQKSSVLTRITNTPKADERYPHALKADRYTFLTDQSGVVNRGIAQRDSVIARIDTTIHYRYVTDIKLATNYTRNILNHTLDVGSNQFLEMAFKDGAYQFYSGSVSEIKPIALKVVDPQLNQTDKALNEIISGAGELSNRAIQIEVETLPISEETATKVDIDNYQFENEKSWDGSPEDTPVEQAEDVALEKPGLPGQKTGNVAPEGEQPEFVLPKRLRYRTAFLPTELITQFDFDFANQIYQRFNGGPYINPGMGAVIKVGALDLFEDYKIEGGMRYSFNGNNTEYFLTFKNRKQRLDKEYTFQRQVLTQQADALTLERIFIHQLRAKFKWPLTEVLGLRGTGILRNDQNVTLSTDRQRLDEASSTVNWVGGKLELVFDNTRQKGLNLYNGTRYKVFAESYYVPQTPNSDILILGADVRHYQKIHRDLIWANRFAASTSLGSRRLVYYMGSVDNWIVFNSNPRFNNDVAIAQDQNYYFQSIATNMRGFIQNIRNGNSFAVINSELRWPVFKYLMNRPIKSDFIKNFQVVGFGDLGTAWTGPSPYSEENAFNTSEVVNGSLRIILDNKKDPIVGSYGIGVRSKLFGYFMRLDHAWGVEDGIVREPMTHFSLGLDF